MNTLKRLWLQTIRPNVTWCRKCYGTGVHYTHGVTGVRQLYYCRRCDGYGHIHMTTELPIVGPCGQRYCGSCNP
jgi:DnaJ-class molecular chaperone